MKVAQLLHKLRIIANVEIVVPLLPEMPRVPNQPPRNSLLQRLQSIRQSIQLRFANRGWPIQARFWLEWESLWFADQKMNMLRHDDIPVNEKPVATPHPLQGQLEDASAFVRG